MTVFISLPNVSQQGSIAVRSAVPCSVAQKSRLTPAPNKAQTTPASLWRAAALARVWGMSGSPQQRSGLLSVPKRVHQYQENLNLPQPKAPPSHPHPLLSDQPHIAVIMSQSSPRPVPQIRTVPFKAGTAAHLRLQILDYLQRAHSLPTSIEQ